MGTCSQVLWSTSVDLYSLRAFFTVLNLTEIVILWPHNGGVSFVDCKELAHVCKYVGLGIGPYVSVEL